VAKTAGIETAVAKAATVETAVAKAATVETAVVEPVGNEGGGSSRLNKKTGCGAGFAIRSLQVNLLTQNCDQGFACRS